MPSLERRGRKYRVRYREGGGLRSTPWRAGRDAALDDLDLVSARLAAHRPAGPRTMSWAELVERWRQDLALRAGERWRLEAPRLALALGERHGWRRAADVRAEHLAGMGRGQVILVRAVCRYANLRLGQASDQQALAMPRSATRRRPRTDLLSDQQVAAAQALADRWGPGPGLLVHLVATYGHRPQSLVGLHVSAIDRVAGTLTLQVKSQDEVRHPVLPATLERAGQAAGGRDQGEPLILSHLGRPWRRGCDAAGWYYHCVGPEVHPQRPGVYELKRWAISRMLGAGLDLATIASITGHRHLPTILRYARTHEDRQRAALAVLGVPVLSPEKS
jgi:hypothetical protein